MKRTESTITQNQNPHGSKRNRYERPIKAILQKALSKFNITYEYLPEIFSKSKINRSYYYKKENKVYWTVEFTISCDLVLYLNKVDDNLLLKDIYSNLLTENKKLEVLNSQYKKFVDTDSSLLLFLLYKEHSAANKPFHYLLDINKSLRENLMNKTILELPRVKIILPSDLNKYNINNQVIMCV